MLKNKRKVWVIELLKKKKFSSYRFEFDKLESSTSEFEYDFFSCVQDSS